MRHADAAATATAGTLAAMCTQRVCVMRRVPRAAHTIIGSQPKANREKGVPNRTRASLPGTRTCSKYSTLENSCVVRESGVTEPISVGVWVG